LICLLCAGKAVTGQDFESDSVYYTPIPKTVEASTTPKKIFRDTVKNDRKFEYFFNVQSGPLVGCSKCELGKAVTFSAATTHGVTIGKKLRTGFGIGFDTYYDWQTLPIFGSVSWDLLGTKNTQALFVLATYGWSSSWHTRSEWDAPTTRYYGGAMFNPQVGYRIKYHDVKISLSVGTKYQEVVTKHEYPTYYYRSDGVMVEGSPSTTTIKQHLRRFMISMAIGWK